MANFDDEDDPLLSINKNDNDKPSGDTILYGRRWLMLLIVGYLQVSNAMNWMSYAPVAVIAADHYDTTTFVINLLSLNFMLVYIPMGFISTYLIKTKGLRYALVVASLGNALGPAVRYGGEFLPHPHIKLVFQFIGQTLAAAAQPTILAGTTPLAATWFGDKERATANTIGMLFNPLGIAAGSVVVSIIVAKPDDFQFGLLMSLIVSGVGFAITLMFFQKTPPTPPTLKPHDLEVDSFTDGLKKLAKNKAYWHLFLSFGIGVGIVNAVLTLLPQILLPNGYDENASSMAVLAFICAGLIGAMVTGIILDMTHWFLSLIKTIFAIAAASMAVFTMCNKPHQYAVVVAMSGMMGFFSFAILPLALELGVEVTYPICEGTSSGFLWTAGQIFGIILLLSMGALKEQKTEYIYNSTTNTTEPGDTVEDMTNSMWLAVGSAVLATLILLPMKSSYLRLEAEAQSKTNALYKQGSQSSVADA